MATDWLAKQEKTRNKLLEKGVEFVFTRVGRTPIDPLIGVIEDRVDTTYSAPGIMLKGAIDAKQWNRDIYAQVSSLIEQGDEVLMLGAGTYDPMLADTVDINGVEWIVKGVGTLRPALIPLLHYVVIRKG